MEISGLACQIGRNVEKMMFSGVNCVPIVSQIVTSSTVIKRL